MSSQDGFIQKREYPRQTSIALVRVSQIAYKGFSYEGKIINISPKGMYLETDASLATNELFKARIIASGELGEGETCVCGIVWFKRSQDPNTGYYKYGVQFFRAPPSVHFGRFLNQPALPYE